METVIFLASIGVLAFVVVWITRRPGKRRELRKTAPEKLTPTTHDRLSRKDEIWEARRQFAQKSFDSPHKFVPRSEQGPEPEYDGYSRRDRHHLTPAGKVKKESRIEDSETFAAE